MVGTGASLHTDQTAGPPFEEREKLAPPELPPHHRIAFGIDAMDLNDILGEIDTDCADFEHEWLLLLGQ